MEKEYNKFNPDEELLTFADEFSKNWENFKLS